MISSLTLLIALFFSALTFGQTDNTLFTEKNFVTISGKRMAYVEVGHGAPIVFLHGNPTSSFLWRNVIPHLQSRGRLIAPDLIGMGDSDKLDFSGPNVYTFRTHANFLFQLLETLGVKEDVTLVLHDWGSALGFLWAFYNRFNPTAVKALIFMESIVAPFPSLDALVSPEDAPFFVRLRGPEGEQLVLEQNVFVEQALPAFIFRNLTEKEFAEYKRPFLNPGEDRRTTLTWPRQLPVADEPKDVVELVQAYSDWLGTSQVRKLFFNVMPGELSNFAVPVVRSWPMVTEVEVRGLHYVQEDEPDFIGKTINEWL